MGLLFIDTETTGLDPETDQLIEIAYAYLDDPEPRTLILPHDRNNVSPEAARVNHYYERGLGDSTRWATLEQLLEFEYDLIAGETLVGANIGFDESFLAKEFPSKKWHYRKLDIESMAYQAFGFPEKVPGMKDIHRELNVMGFDIPEPDHTAAGDVRALVASFNALKELRWPVTG